MGCDRRVRGKDAGRSRAVALGTSEDAASCRRARPSDTTFILRRPPDTHALPVGRLVVLQELPPHVLAGVEAVDDRVDDARGAVHDVEWRTKAVLGGLLLGDVQRILV